MKRLLKAAYSLLKANTGVYVRGGLDMSPCRHLESQYESFNDTMDRQNLSTTGRCYYGLDTFFSISKCRTAGRHAGVDLTRSTPNRVLSVQRSIDTYRRVTLTVNSVFTQSLQFINSLYLLKCKHLGFYLS